MTSKELKLLMPFLQRSLVVFIFSQPFCNKVHLPLTL
jgi:hypothetical protein